MLVLALSASSQDNGTAKTVKQFFTEAGGPGILFSANLDSRFAPTTRMGWGFRAGLGFTLVNEEYQVPGNSYYNDRTRSVATVPLGINYLFGKPGSPNMFEAGAGFTLLSRKSSLLAYDGYNSNKKGYLLGHFDFMYRRQPPDGGFSWRIGFTPLINPEGDIVPFGAIGLGFAFK